MKSNSFYSEDLAYVHHAGFSGFAQKAGDDILAMLASANIRSGLVIDLGCGDGSWARKLNDNGYAVFGVDLSADMIAHARIVAPASEFKIGSLYDAALRPCSAVTALGEALNYRAGGMPSDTALRDLFQRIAANLIPNGMLVFDVIVKDDLHPMSYRSWSQGPDWAVLVDVSEDIDQDAMARDITIFREVAGHYRKSTEQHVITVHHDYRIGCLLKEAGFEFTSYTAYGNQALAPRRLAYVARKKACV